MKGVTIFMYGQPIGKGRPRFTRIGRVYTPEKTRKFEHKLAAAASDYMALHDLEPTEKPCKVLIKAQFEIPKSWTKAKKAAAEANEIYPKKPDADNIAKIVLDSLNSIIWDDDAQVYDLRVIKTYGDPRLVTEITW
jgi:Holliday junction resolvase RusA-like endonuclease